MRKSAIATTLILSLSVVAIIADLSKQGYMSLADTNDIRNALPNITPPQFAKILKGNDKGCLTKPSQTKPVTLNQIRTLRQLTDPDAIAALLGNSYCQTATGFKWITESGKELNLKFNKTLDYDFSQSAPQSLTNKKRTSKEADGVADRDMPARVSAPSLITEGKSATNK
jgi:hypothetical protein